MDFGKRIQMKRKALGLSVEELARRAKCSKGLIAQWECGLLPKKLNKGKIAQVKRILKVRVSGTKRHITPPPSRNSPAPQAPSPGWGSHPAVHRRPAFGNVEAAAANGRARSQALAACASEAG